MAMQCPFSAADATMSTQTNPNSQGKGKTFVFSWKHLNAGRHIVLNIFLLRLLWFASISCVSNVSAQGWFRQCESFIKFDFGTRTVSGFQHVCQNTKNIASWSKFSWVCWKIQYFSVSWRTWKGRKQHKCNLCIHVHIRSHASLIWNGVNPSLIALEQNQNCWCC